MSKRLAVLGLAALLCAGASPARAQTLRVEGAWTDSATAVIRAVAEGGEFLLIQRDTVLPAEFVHAGDLVVARARVRLEGRVTGRVVVLDGELFIRPGAAIEGPVAVAAGGFYRSGLATTGPVSHVAPVVRVELTGSGDDLLLTLTPPPEPPRLALTGIRGLGIPTYDRVDGLTLSAGARVRLGRDPEGAALRAVGLLHTARGAVDGVVGVDLPLHGRAWAVVEGGRRTETNERWIRGDLTNSLAALFVGSDIRNYYSSTFLEARLERRPSEPLVSGESFVGPWIGIRVSEDRSLSTRDVWSLFRDDEGWRANPGISEGRIASALAGATADWRGVATQVSGELGLEWAPPAFNDVPFFQAVGDARIDAVGLRGHLLSLRLHAMGTISDSGAPFQRWSVIGGPGTLPTEPDALHEGDQLLFAHSSYAIPLTRLAVPFLGPPSLTLQHAIGMAWVGRLQRPDLRQNLGVGASFRLVHAELWIDPSTGLRDPVLSLGAQLPF